MLNIVVIVVLGITQWDSQQQKIASLSAITSMQKFHPKAIKTALFKGH